MMNDGQGSLPTTTSEPLPPTAPAELRKLDPKTLQVAEQYFLQAKFHSGPLPPAEDLAGYESAFPGAAAEIIGMARAEQDARHYCMRAEVDGIRRGQLCAVIAFVAAMATCCYLGAIGATAAAGTIGTAAITVFGGAFLLGRHFNTSEQKENKEPVQNESAEKNLPRPSKKRK